MDKEKILKDVETLADLLFTHSEVMDITGALAVDLCSSDWRNQLDLAYKKGKYTRMVKLRMALLQLADNGSHPALEKAFTLFDKQNAQNV